MEREVSARRLRDVPPPAVIRRDGQREPRVGGGLRLAGGHELANAPIEHRRVADHLEADSVRVELRDLLLQRAHEELHQDRDFVGRAPPVLAGEREQRQELDVELDAGKDDGAHRLDAPPVAGDPRQHALLRPAAVAVHDDRDVARDGGRRGDVAGGARKHGGSGGGRNDVRVGDGEAMPLRPPSGRLPWPRAPCRSPRCSGR